MWRRSGEFARRAEYYAVEEDHQRSFVMRTNNYIKETEIRLEETISQRASLAGNPEALKINEANESMLRRELDDRSATASRWVRRADFNAQLKEKYRRAARYPFLPIAPDPSAPSDPQ
jgi:hypothetical protein